MRLLRLITRQRRWENFGFFLLPQHHRAPLAWVSVKTGDVGKKQPSFTPFCLNSILDHCLTAFQEQTSLIKQGEQKGNVAPCSQLSKHRSAPCQAPGLVPATNSDCRGAQSGGKLP